MGQLYRRMGPCQGWGIGANGTVERNPRQCLGLKAAKMGSGSKPRNDGGILGSLERHECTVLALAGECIIEYDA